MELPDGHVILVSALHPFAGAQREKCMTCPNYIFEDPRNLEVIKAKDGFIICVSCAIKLKAQHPNFGLDGQLWEGAVRVPQSVGPYKIIEEFLRRKP